MSETNDAAPEAEATPDAAPAAVPSAEAVPPVEPKKAEPLSPKFAAIAKEEARIRAERTAVKREREEWEKSKAERAAEAKLRETDPIAWLKTQNLSYEKLTEFAISGKVPEVEKEEPIHPEVEKLKKQLAEIQDEKARAMVADFRRSMESSIQEKAADFEYVTSLPDGMDTVMAVIEAHAAETGEVLSPLEAAARVEAAFEEQFKPLLSVKKFVGKLTPAAPKPEEQSAASESGPARAAPRTLSNSHAAAAPKSPPREPTEAERRQAAIDYLKKRAATP